MSIMPTLFNTKILQITDKFAESLLNQAKFMMNLTGQKCLNLKQCLDTAAPVVGKISKTSRITCARDRFDNTFRNLSEYCGVTYLMSNYRSGR